MSSILNSLEARVVWDCRKKKLVLVSLVMVAAA